MAGPGLAGSVLARLASVRRSGAALGMPRLSQGKGRRCGGCRGTVGGVLTRLASARSAGAVLFIPGIAGRTDVPFF